MKKLLTFVWLTALVSVGTVTAQTGARLSAPPAGTPFIVFDNMAYAGKPDLSTNGLVPSCVIYNHAEMKTAIAAGQLPDEAAFKQLVKSRAAGRPGPVVIDIEYVFLSQTRGTTDAEVKQHFKLFITLARWAHEAAPGHCVGYYGHGLFPEEPGKEYAAEKQQLIAAVDAFFPSMYSFGNQTPAKWQEKLQFLLAQAHELAPGKPVYPYVWGQYHEGSPKALEFLDGDRMKWELETARDCGADGVVFWSGAKPAWKFEPCFQAMLKFVADKPQRRGDGKLKSVAPGKNGRPGAFELE